MTGTASGMGAPHVEPPLVVYGLLWAFSAAGALLAALGGLDLTDGRPRDALPARPGTLLELVVHNAPVVLWPLALVAVGWAAIPIVRNVGDALIAGHLAGQGLLVGFAVGEYSGLWRYLPHLPIEWLALSIPATAWLTARKGHPVAAARSLLLTGLLITGAALVETYGVPI